MYDRQYNDLVHLEILGRPDGNILLRKLLIASEAGCRCEVGRLLKPFVVCSVCPALASLTRGTTQLHPLLLPSHHILLLFWCNRRLYAIMSSSRSYESHPGSSNNYRPLPAQARNDRNGRIYEDRYSRSPSRDRHGRSSPIPRHYTPPHGKP